MPWQASEEDREVHTPADVCVDPDAPRWLQLSPSDTANLTGTLVQKMYLLFQIFVPKGVCTARFAYKKYVSFAIYHQVSFIMFIQK